VGAVELYRRKLFGCNLGEESLNHAAHGLAQLGYPVFIFVCCGNMYHKWDKELPRRIDQLP
jgi:hypothetical protein